MGSSGKKRTTMAKLNRETKLRERRLDKQARKDARKQAPQEGWLGDAPIAPGDDPAAQGDGQTAADAAAQAPDGAASQLPA